MFTFDTIIEEFNSITEYIKEIPNDFIKTTKLLESYLKKTIFPKEIQNILLEDNHLVLNIVQRYFFICKKFTYEKTLKELHDTINKKIIVNLNTEKKNQIYQIQ